MKVLFFIGSISGGGAERVVCNLADFLVNSGNEVVLLTVGKTENTYGLSERVKILSLEGEKRIKFNFLRAAIKMFRLKKQLKACDYDVCVAFLPKTIKALMRYKKFIKCPVVLSERCSPLIYGKRKQKDMLKCFSAADGTVFQTDDIKNFYADRISLKKPTVIPNAVNPEFIKPPFKGERRKVVVAAGRHDKQKNFELLIDAFCEALKDFPDYTLEIYGKGSLTCEYKERCERLRIADRVKFPGFSADIADKFYGASLFVMTSDYEGVPNALIEAMALNTPVVSTDCEGGGARLLINNGENGILIEKGDKNALVRAIKAVLGDKVLSEKLALNAANVAKTFAPEKIYSEWENYLKEVVNEV